MQQASNISTIEREIGESIQLAKCQQCGCMRGALEAFVEGLQTIHTPEADTLIGEVAGWSSHLKPVRYACLGCSHCYPAVAENAFGAAFPAAILSTGLSCNIQIGAEGWPPVVGEYHVLEKSAPVAVTTLSNAQLAGELANRKPLGLAIVGKTETENIGIDKILKNVVANLSIQCLIIAGAESQGHQSGETLLALKENGVDENRRVIGSTGKRPILRNVTHDEINSFRKQVQMINMIGCEDPAEIEKRIVDLASAVAAQCTCSECSDRIDECSDEVNCTCNGQVQSVASAAIPTLIAVDTDQQVVLDKAGYFVILPVAERGVINIEHYAYDNTLLRVIEGANARGLYLTVIANKWVTELSHAAYLGKELAKAELALQHGFKYMQDGA